MKKESAFPAAICSFISYTLQSARSKGIKRLYFLARDGYIMLNAAKIIAERHSIDIELRYLYCSRIALRNAALSDLGEEAYRYLLEGGFSLTPRIILGRLRLNREERRRVYNDIAFTDDENTEMGKTAAADFCGRLRKSSVYNSFIKSVSEKCKEAATAYLEQEGLLSDTPCGIVDSGWTGSMQRMLRVLTGRRQTGFYFGMYSRGNPEDGEFNTFLFDKSTSPFLVSKFNNNLFETLCSAPHGMTEGYKREEERIVPILKDEKSLNSDSRLLSDLEREIYRYAEEVVYPPKETTMQERQKAIFPLLDSLMYKPDRETAEIYGSLRFSDDPAELNSCPLAGKLESTKKLYFVPRLADKLFKKGKANAPVFWSYGTAVLNGKGWFIGVIAGTNDIYSEQPDSSEGLLQSGKMYSYCFSQGHNRNIYTAHDASQGHNAFFEMLLGSESASLMGFDCDGTPVFSENEEGNIEAVRQIHSGAMDFCEDYLKSFADYPYMLNISGSDAYAPFLAAARDGNRYFKAVLGDCSFNFGIGTKGERLKENV